MSGYFTCTELGIEFFGQTKNVFIAEDIIKGDARMNI